MAFHYCRDANIIGTASYHGNWPERTAFLYHFMRVNGCRWIWECDGQVGTGLNPNHVEDGNMEETGVPIKYVGVNGGVVSKDAVEFKSGSRSLKISSTNGGDGGRTVALLSMSNVVSRSFDAGDSLTGPVNEIMTLNDNNNPFISDHGGRLITFTGETQPGNNGTFVLTRQLGAAQIKFQNPSGVATSPPTGSYVIRCPYEIVLWAFNDSGVTWDVTVDQGDGVLVTVGTIPDNSGVWTEYHFQFATLSTGSRYIYITCPTTGAYEINIDCFQVFTSMFESHRLNANGDGDAGHYPADGQLINPDHFSSASYVPSAKDIGRWLFVYDPTNPTNSGVYKIIADIGGGVVRVDLRSGTATFTTSLANLCWRIVDIEGQFHWTASSTPAQILTCGVGFESKHSSKWRLFHRHMLMTGTTLISRGTVLWASPEDTDFDSSTGHFYTDGPSSMRSRQGEYTYWAGSTPPSVFQHVTAGPGSTAASTTRTFIMTDDDCSFFNLMHWRTATDGGSYSVGYTGSDADHPGVEEFILWSRSDSSNFPCEWDTEGSLSYTSTMWNGGTGFSSYELAVPSTLGLLAARYVSDTSIVINQTNNGDNPWSGEEIVYPAPIVRDHTGDEGCPSIREANGMGLYMGRNNLPQLATFDSNQYLHFNYGVIWKWNGAATLP
jgi:hypothetical protein